jgi:hypothetical protein
MRDLTATTDTHPLTQAHTRRSCSHPPVVTHTADMYNIPAKHSPTPLRSQRAWCRHLTCQSDDYRRSCCCSCCAMKWQTALSAAPCCIKQCHQQPPRSTGKDNSQLRTRNTHTHTNTHANAHMHTQNQGSCEQAGRGNGSCVNSPRNA